MTDAWDWWRAKLAGEKMQANPETPHPGFYRWVRKDRYGGKKWAEPVAYWPGENGEVRCRIGDDNVISRRGNELWNSVNDDPVPEEWYREVTEKEPPEPQWRDGLPLAPQADDNEPPENRSFE